MQDQPACDRKVETKFICVAEELPLGTWRDGWLVVWCQPDRQRVLWHAMLRRSRIEFRGAAIEGGSVHSINALTGQHRAKRLALRCRAPWIQDAFLSTVNQTRIEALLINIPSLSS